MTALRTHSVGALLVAGAAIAALPSGATASDPGIAAADLVSEASYRDFLDNWLYTRLGDDRGFGPEHDLARDNIVALLESFGLEVTLEPFLYSGTTYYNVVGTKLGTLHPDQEYIVGAHFDSANNPGADDNASGTALILEAARVLGQFDSAYTIRFVAFDREEQGLYGSYAYVDAHGDDDILGMVSTDMVAYNIGTNTADIRGGSGSSSITQALAAAVAEYGDGLQASLGGASGGSNHAPFEQAGIPACLFIEDWGNPHYHSALDSVDTPDYIDYAFATRFTRSIVGLLVDLAGVEVPFDGLRFEFPDGLPVYVDPDGGSSALVLVSGVGGVIPSTGTGILHYDLGAGWESAAMEEIELGLYRADFPAADCGTTVSYYLTAEGDDGTIYLSPAGAPSSTHAARAAYGEAIAFEDKLDTDPGWADEDLWGFGVPTGGGGEYGGPDPTSGFTGANVLGYNLLGDYQNNLPERHLTTDPIDCSAMFGTTLRFQRWLGVERSDYDHASVRVSNDGTTWVTAWENQAEVADTAWTEVAYDISEVADGQPTVWIRWTMGTTDSGWRYCGWNIDDVQLIALDCAAPCPADLNGDTAVDVSDLLTLLAAWGTDAGDVTGDGTTDIADLLAVLAAWGPC